MWFDLVLAILIAALVAPVLSIAVRWRAPGRKDTRLRSLAGFFPPALLLAWGTIGVLGDTAPDTWGALCMLVGALGLIVALLLADVATFREPSTKEARRVKRRGDLLDPVYSLYMAAVLLGVAAAGVTRYTFTTLA